MKHFTWRKKLAVGVSTAVATVGTMTASVFASTTTDFSPITDAISQKLTVAEVSGIIASVIGAGIGFVLLWWGARKLIRSLITAFQNGKIKL